jgi:hypothetical protein
MEGDGRPSATNPVSPPVREPLRADPQGPGGAPVAVMASDRPGQTPPSTVREFRHTALGGDLLRTALGDRGNS